MAVNHFKEFQTVSEYEAYIQPDDYAKPLVALVDETDTVMFPQGGGGGGGNPILKSVDVEDFSGTTFYGCGSYITEVNIPSDVTNIRQEAFLGCSSLTSITIPSGVTTILNGVFKNCSSLTSINIPSGLTQIETYVFQNCSSLTSITIPSGVTSIGKYAFSGCSSLISFTCLATTPPTLGTNALQNTHANMEIQVPPGSVSAYKAASGWSNYASQIVPISG